MPQGCPPSIQSAHPISLSAPCSLVALSAVTGRAWTDLRDEFGHFLVKGAGMYWSSIVEVLKHYGFRGECISEDQTTLAAWIKAHDPKDPTIYMLHLRQHVEVVEGNAAVGLGELTTLERMLSRQGPRSRVYAVYRVKRNE